MSYINDKKVMSWDFEADHALLKAILGKHALCIDYEAVANMLGCTERAVDEHVKRLRKMALRDLEEANGKGNTKSPAKQAKNTGAANPILAAAQAHIQEKKAAPKQSARKHPGKRNAKGKGVEADASPSKKRKLDLDGHSSDTIASDINEAVANMTDGSESGDEQEDDSEYDRA